MHTYEKDRKRAQASRQPKNWRNTQRHGHAWATNNTSTGHDAKYQSTVASLFAIVDGETDLILTVCRYACSGFEEQLPK